MGLLKQVALLVALGFTWRPEIVKAAGALHREELQSRLEALTRGFDGRIGVCVSDSKGNACVNGNERFSLQSVMKLVVCLVVMDSVDRGKMRLDEPVFVTRQDLSLYVQPLAELVGSNGYNTTIADLVRRAVVDSDSATEDILMRKLGGPQAVQAFLKRRNLRGISVDRDERHLQTEIVGLTWRPEYVEASVLARAIAEVPDDQRTAAYVYYRSDPRDTATPSGMAKLLEALALGKLLSPSSTSYLLDVMSQTVTFPDRLKAGVPRGWKLGHKTGTSGSWQGITAATNDVGILQAPDGGRISIAVFIGDSRASAASKAALMARLASETITQYY